MPSVGTNCGCLGKYPADRELTWRDLPLLHEGLEIRHQPGATQSAHFLLGAIAAGLVEAGGWGLDLRIVWGLALVGVGAAFAIEWRMVGQQPVSNAR